MHDYNLEDIIDIKLLQGFQDSFSKYSGIAAVITNSEGSCITRPSGFSKNCNNVSRTSTNSISKCMSFFITGAKKSISDNQPFIQKCHEGLYSIVAPIMLKEQFIGALVCGQILCIDEDNTEIYENSAVYYKTADEIQHIAEYTHSIAKLISAIIDKNYILIKSNQLRSESFYSKAKAVPEDFGIERIYNIHELTSSIKAGIEVICQKHDITAKINILNQIPPELLGTPSAIQYVIEGIVSFVAPYNMNSTLNIDFSCSQTYYSHTLGMKLSVYSGNNTSEKLNEIKEKFRLKKDNVPEGASLITYIIDKMLSGNLSFGISDESTITINLSIPQLDLKVN